MKNCKVCLENKDLLSYDGNRNTCRKCRNIKNLGSFFSKEGNIERVKLYSKEYQKIHRENNPYYKLYGNCLSRIRYQLKKENSELRNHIESLFSNEMNWNNYGSYWEIDHIISAVKMAKLGYSIDEINKISNIRPLTIKENRERRKLS